MDKRTTLEEFEKGMTENLSYLQRNTKEGNLDEKPCLQSRTFLLSLLEDDLMHVGRRRIRQGGYFLSHLRPLTAIRWRQWKRGWNPHGDCPNPHVSGWCAYHHFQGC